MKTKLTLNELLHASANKKLLFLGKEGLFTKKEIIRFLKKYKITFTKHIEDNVIGVVEYHSLNPIEEDISCEAYEATIPLYSLESFEKILSLEINDDELLMGIKLTNDQDRIFRLLGNANIKDELFVKLLMLYRWQIEEEDNRYDRDVIMFTLRRYIRIKPNEEDLLYSYLTLRRLATQTTQANLLLALMQFPNFEFVIRGKEKITLRETIARNHYITQEITLKLLSLKEEKIKIALASNYCVSLNYLEKLSLENSPKINQALATNKSLNNTLFNRLLEDKKAIKYLLFYQEITLERLGEIEKLNLEKNIFEILGSNEQLTQEVKQRLLHNDEVNLICHLAKNSTLTEEQLTFIYDKDIQESFEYLALNPATPINLLEVFYKHYKDNMSVLKALAYNSSTPQKILKVLFEKDNFEITQKLATNASLPLELLDILKVDTRLQNELAQNEVFVKEYETVLEYDKNAISGKVL